MRFSRIGCFLLSTLLAGIPGLALPPGPQPLQKGRPASTPLSRQQKRALWTLAQLFDLSRQSQDQVFRIEAEAHVADVLWKHDRKRARIYFADAFRAVASIKSEEQGPAAPASGQAKEKAIKAGLRRRLAGMISRHDPALAENLLRELLQSNDHADEAALFPEAATGAASADVQRAVELARAGLKTGITPEFVKSLNAIRAMEPQAADRLFYDSLAAAARNSDKFGSDLRLLASYVFPPGEVSADAGEESGLSDSGAAPPLPTQGGDEQLIRNFLNFAFQSSSALSSGDSSQSPARLIPYAQLMQFLPYYQRYLPDIASRITGAFNQLVSSNPDPVKRSLLANLLRPPSADKIVKAAGSLADPAQKDLFYRIAALQASRNGNLDQALMAADLISDREVRQKVKSTAYEEAALRALDHRDIDTACKYAAEVSDLSQQSRVYAQIIRILAGKKEMARANAVLDSAEPQLLKAEEGADKARALLLLASVALPVDQIRATAILQLAVVAINHSAFLDGDRKSQFPSGGIEDKTAPALTLNSLNFQASFGALARLDFDAALSLAQSIAQQEISIHAQIAACQGVLLKAPGRKQEKTRNNPKNMLAG